MPYVHWNKGKYLYRFVIIALLTMAVIMVPTLSTTAQVDDGADGLLSMPFGTQDAPRSERRGDELRLFNDYIAIIVNASDDNTARFAVETTGGDPDRLGDEQSPLIYRVPGQLPWTSYTTVRIDGDDYVFGGPATERAGRTAETGRPLISPNIVDDRLIESAYSFNDINVTQLLSIIRSTTTGLPDTARIEYRIDNVGAVPRRVGLRVMLDTMIGPNDGAPFRVEELAVTTDHAFFGGQVPQFWQAFDSISDPRVTSQGTLTGDGVTAPNRAYFTNWGSLADGVWEFDFEPGRNFTRLGDFQLDSAMALYWDPLPLQPGESRTYVTQYGLGGISISPGQLSIGVTSPATVTADPTGQTSFLVVAYVQNTGEGDARGAMASIQLPRGLRLASGEQTTRFLGDLPPGRTGQVTWRVQPDDSFLGGDLTYTVNVQAINAEPNAVGRSIRVVSPAKLEVTIQNKEGRLSTVDGALSPVPYTVNASVQNVGGSDAGGVWARWESPIGLTLSPGDRPEKPLGPIAAGESVDVIWHVTPTTPPFTGNLAYVVVGAAVGGADEARTSGFLNVPLLEPEVRLLYVGPETLRVGDLFTVDVVAQHIRQFHGAKIAVAYDDTVVRLAGGTLGVDRGRLFPSTANDSGSSIWGAPRHTRTEGGREIAFEDNLASAQLKSVEWASDTVATLHFQAVGEGSVTLSFSDVHVQRLRTIDGEEQVSDTKVEAIPLTLTVTSE